MKTKSFLLTLGMAALMTSCAPKIQYTEYVGFIDYSAYQHHGIFLTESNSVSFDYDAIGSVTAEVYSGNTVFSEKELIDKNDIYGEHRTVKTQSGWKEARPEDAIQAAAAKVVSKGGDGLINIRITPITGGAGVARSGFLITGMAIKRK